MLIDMAQAVGGYLHDVFVGTADWGILVGYIAQAMFAMRFVVQWIASERAGRSVVPTAFWVFSIGGGLMLLGYALYRKDPVFIIGQAFGVFVYLRNLQFVMRSGSTTAAAKALVFSASRPRANARGGLKHEPSRQIHVQDRPADPQDLPDRCGSVSSVLPVPIWLRSGTRCNRTRSPGSRSRPTNSQDQTVSARSEKHVPIARLLA